MSRPTLVLVTNSYPAVGSAEKGFVFPEILALSRSEFDVTLMPVRKIDAVDPELPGNITIDETLSKSFGVGSLVKAMVAALVFRPVWAELIRRPRLAFRYRFWKEALRAVVGRAVFSSHMASTDVFYTFWFTGDTIALASQVDVPVVTRAHGYDLYEEVPVNKGYIPFRRSFNPNLLIVLSRQASTYLRERFGFEERNVCVIPLGVDNQDQSPLPGASQLTIVSCSFPTPNKRLPEILAFAARLAELYPEQQVHWHHFGGLPPQFDGLAGTASNLTMTSHGKVSRDSILRFYREHAVSLFVNLSLTEGMPVSIMEAMSFGIPVLAPAIGGIPEMFEEGGGLLMPADCSGAAAADMFSKVYDESHWRLLQGARAWQVQRERFNSENNGQAVVDRLMAMFDQAGEDDSLR